MQQATPQRGSSSSRRTRAIIGLVAMIVGALTTTIGFSAGTSLAYEGPVQMPSTSESNDPAEWGEGCWKLDESGGKTWTADADYSIVVLKAAQVDWVFYDVEEGDVLEVGQQDISHFIFCPPTPTTTSTTSSTTSTTTTSTTSTTTSTTSTTTTTTTLPCEWNPQLPPDDPDCTPPTTTSTTTSTTTTTTTTTTLPCEWNPQLPPDDPGCTPPTTTTEPPEPTLEIEALRPVCVADTPYIDYAIALSNLEASTATLELRDVEGTLVETLPNMPLSGRIIWPGASVDPLDWPGWKLEDGLWVPDETDTLLRDGIFVTAIVNPEATAEVSYPPATEACNGPEIPDPTTTTEVAQEGPTTTAVGSGSATTLTVAPELPATGADSTRTMVMLGMGLMLFGLTLLLGSRRPETL